MIQVTVETAKNGFLVVFNDGEGAADMLVASNESEVKKFVAHYVTQYLDAVKEKNA